MFEKMFQSQKPSQMQDRAGVGEKNVHAMMGRMVGQVLIFGVRIYQVTLRMIFPPSCRFHPSCSEYAVEALRRFGPIKGGWLSLRRLSKCHPFNPGGFDPLP